MDDGGKIGDDVAEQVLGDDHVVVLGLLDEPHGAGVHVVVVLLDLWIELVTHLFVHAHTQIPAVGEHVALVNKRQHLLLALVGDLAFDRAVLLSDAYDYPKNTASRLLSSLPPGTAELDHAILKTTRALLRLSYADANLLITQRGRLRLYRLRDEILNRDRVRDDFGILWSKRHWLPDLEVRLRFRQPTEPLSLLLLDVDRLKLINTTFAHAGADEVLRGIFEIVRDKIQPADAYHDEAGTILPVVDNAHARSIAEDIRATIERTFEKRKMEGSLTPTVTLAVGTAIDSVSAEDFHRRVDLYLTAKKDQGGLRNAVHVLEGECAAK